MLPQGRVVMGVRMDVVKGVAPLPIKLLVLLCREELAVTIPVPAAAVRSIRSATARKCKSSHLKSKRLWMGNLGTRFPIHNLLLMHLLTSLKAISWYFWP